MQAEDTIILQHLDVPELYPILPLDETMIVSLPVVLGFFKGFGLGMLVGFAFGLTFLIAYRRISKGKGAIRLQRLAFWHLPASLVPTKNFPDSSIRVFVR